MVSGSIDDRNLSIISSFEQPLLMSTTICLKISCKKWLKRSPRTPSFVACLQDNRYVDLSMTWGASGGYVIRALKIREQKRFAESKQTGGGLIYIRTPYQVMVLRRRVQRGVLVIASSCSSARGLLLELHYRCSVTPSRSGTERLYRNFKG